MPPLEYPKKSGEDNPPPFPDPNKGSIRDIGIVRPSTADQTAALRAGVEHAKEMKREETIQPLKTYQSDVAAAIKKDNVSVIKMALAEKKRQEAQGLTQEAVVTDRKRSWVYFAGAAALIVAGIAIIGYFIFSGIGKGGTALNIPNSLIYTEKNTELELNKADPDLLVNEVGKIKRESRPPSTLENLIITEKDVGTSTRIELGARHLITGSRLITLLNTRIPGQIFRSIVDTYMLGVYQPQSSPNSEVFMIVKSDSYEIAYAGMLDWEATLEQDMTPLFSIPQPVAVNATSTVVVAPNSTSTDSGTSAATSTATTSLPVRNPLLPATPPKPFVDRLIMNRDTRSLLDPSGKIVFLYSFIDPHTVIFAQSEEAFKEVVGRYLQTGQEK